MENQSSNKFIKAIFVTIVLLIVVAITFWYFKAYIQLGDNGDSVEKTNRELEKSKDLQSAIIREKSVFKIEVDENSLTELKNAPDWLMFFVLNPEEKVDYKSEMGEKVYLALYTTNPTEEQLNRKLSAFQLLLEKKAYSSGWQKKNSTRTEYFVITEFEKNKYQVAVYLNLLSDEKIGVKVVGKINI